MVLLHFFQFIKSDPGQGNFEKLRVPSDATGMVTQDSMLTAAVVRRGGEKGY